MEQSYIGDIQSLVIYFVAVITIIGFMLLISYYLGERHTGRARGEPYESGIVPFGTARIRFDIKFYLVAVFFVIFDLEAVFIIAWAVSVRETGWHGFIEIFIFILVLLAALIYLWREGGLDWSPSKKRFDQE